MIKNRDDVKPYVFESFNEVTQNSGDVKVFEFTQLDIHNKNARGETHQKTIKQERIVAREKQFKINDIVKEYRGFKDQEEREYEDKVEEEVQRRLEAIKEEAFKVGYEEGVNQGREEVFEQMRGIVDQKIDDLNGMINDVLATHEEIVSNQKKQIYQLVRNLSKWVILRELKDDGKYVERLLEKLVHEIQTKRNLLVQVGAEDFSQMEDVLNHLQSKLGELTNVRVEVNHKVATRGIIVESENGIIDATIEEQFEALDKLFEDVIANQ